MMSLLLIVIKQLFIANYFITNQLLCFDPNLTGNDIEDIINNPIYTHGVIDCSPPEQCTYDLIYSDFEHAHFTFGSNCSPLCTSIFSNNLNEKIVVLEAPFNQFNLSTAGVASGDLGKVILAFPEGSLIVNKDQPPAPVLIYPLKNGKTIEAYGGGETIILNPEGSIIIKGNGDSEFIIKGFIPGSTITTESTDGAPIPISINGGDTILSNDGDKITTDQSGNIVFTVSDIVLYHCFLSLGETYSVDVRPIINAIGANQGFYINNNILKKDFTKNGTFVGDVAVSLTGGGIMILKNINISVLCPTISAPYDGYIFDGTDSISFNGTIDSLGGCTGIVVTINNGTITLNTSSASLDIATKQWTALFDQKDLATLVDGNYTLEIGFSGNNCVQVNKTCDIIKDSRNIFESIKSSCEIINGKLVYYMSFLREVNVDGIGIDLFVKKYSNKRLKKGFKWQVIDTDLEISNEGSLIQGYSKNFIAKFTPKEDGNYTLERYKNDDLHDYWGNIVGPMKSNECFVELPKPYFEENQPSKRTKIPNDIEEIIYRLSEYSAYVFNNLNVDTRNVFYANKDSLLEYAKFKDENLDRFKNLIPVVQFAFANNACSIAIYEQFESIPGNGLLEYFDKLSHEQQLEYANDCQKITDFLHKYLENLSKKVETNINILEDKTLIDKALTITKEKQLDYDNLMSMFAYYEDSIEAIKSKLEEIINVMNSQFKNSQINPLRIEKKKIAIKNKSVAEKKNTLERKNKKIALPKNVLSKKSNKADLKIIKNNQNFITVDLSYIKEGKENANKEYLQKISDKIFYDNKNKISKNYIIKYGDSMINFTEIEDSPFYFGYSIKKGVDAMGYYRQIKLNTIKDENKFEFGSYFVITKSKHYLYEYN